MTAIAAVRRKRTAFMVIANLVVLLVIGGLGYAGQAALREYKGAKLLQVNSTKLPSPPVALLATVDADNELTSATVFVLTSGSEQVGGSIVSVPISSDSTPGIAPARTPLTESYRVGGTEALVLAVESTLLITFDIAVVATPAEAEALFATVAPVTAEFEADVPGMANGSTVTLFNAGDNSLSEAQVVQVLNARTANQRESERRSATSALWAGVAAAVGDGRTTVDAVPPATLPGIDAFVQRLFAGPVAVRTLPTSTVSATDNPDRKDVEMLDKAEAVFILASIAPGAMSAPSPDLTFRVEAPPGYEDRVRFAVRAILYLGANVVSVYLGAEEHPETRYYIDDPQLVEKAQNTNALFGNTVNLTPDNPTEGVDVVLQLGTDFLTIEGDELPSTTTSTTEPS